MDVSSLIASFSTGSYTVTRTARGTMRRGRVEDPTVTSVTVTASVSPASGEDMQRLPEGRRTTAAKAIYTTTQLYVGGQGGAYEADVVSIDGSTWEIERVEPWRDPDGVNVGYRCLAVSLP